MVEYEMEHPETTEPLIVEDSGSAEEGRADGSASGSGNGEGSGGEDTAAEISAHEAMVEYEMDNGLHDVTEDSTQQNGDGSITTTYKKDPQTETQKVFNGTASRC